MALKIEEHMNRRVLTAAPTDTLEHAAQAMIDRKVGSAVVVRDKVHIGIVTERDVLRAVARGTVPWSTKIEDVMTADPVCATLDLDVASATRLMLDGGFRHLPVEADGKLVGIVSLRDLLILLQADAEE